MSAHGENTQGSLYYNTNGYFFLVMACSAIYRQK